MINNYSYLFILFLLLHNLSANGQSNIKTTVSDVIPLDQNVRYGQLDNGFTYYIRRNKVPQEEIRFQMVVKAGTFHEDEDQSNYAHLLEHMGAKGTIHFPKVRDHFKPLGGYTHALTGNVQTFYWGRIPSGDKTLLKDALQVVRDWAQGITFSQESIDVERGAVLGEMRNHDPSSSFVHKTSKHIMLSNTGAKLFNSKDRSNNIRNFKREPFLRFYQDWYRPDLQAAIIVGDVNVDSVELEIKHLFSDLEMSDQPRDAEAITTQYATKLSGKNQYVSVIDSVWSNYLLNIRSKRYNRGFRPKTAEDYKAMLVQELFGELLQPRINALFRQYNTPFSRVSLNYEYLDMAYTGLTIPFDSSNPSEVKEKVFQALIALKTISTGISETALREAKTNILKRYPKEHAVTSSTLATRYRNYFVRGAAAPGPGRERTLITELLDQITLADVEKYIRECIDLEQNTDFVFFAPGKNTEVPDSSTIKSWIAQVNAMDVQPYAEQTEHITSLKEVAQIPFQNSTSIERMSENLLGITTIELSNGIKLLLKPDKSGKNPHAGNVSLRAYRPIGVPENNQEEYLAATIAAGVVKHAGAGPYAKFVLEDYKAEKGIRLNIKLDNTEQTIRGSSKENNLEDLLRLLYLYTNSPREDSEAFRDWKTHKREELSGNRGNTASNFYVDKIDALRYPGIPAMRLEDLDQLTMEKVYSVYDQWFSGFGGYTFIVTGDFDKDSVASVLVKYLSAFPKGRRSFRNVAETPAILLRKMDETIYLNNIDQAYIRLYFPIKVPTDIKSKAILSILGSALRSKIWDRLRQGSYGPAAYGRFVDAKNGLYQFGIIFDSELGNEDNMIRYAMEEFRLLRDKGIDEQLFENLLAKEKEDFSRSIERGAFWYDYLKEKQDNGEDLETEVLQYQTVLEHFISLEDVNDAAKKYLSEEYFQQFVVLPEGYQQEN